jgi:hypothetical protein
MNAITSFIRCPGTSEDKWVNSLETIETFEEKLSQISDMEITMSNFTESTTSKISILLRSFLYLKNLDCIITNYSNNNSITTSGEHFQQLCKCLLQHGYLKSLHIVDVDEISDQHLPGITQLLASITLKSLKLDTDNREISCNPENAKKIQFALENNKTLEEISLNFSYFEGKLSHKNSLLARAIVRSLTKNNTLTSLTLVSINLGIKGNSDLAMALNSNSTLTYLFLLNVFGLGVNGVENKFTQSLKNNSTLQTLKLINSDVFEETCPSKNGFTEFLKTNTSLTYLNLEDARLTIKKCLEILDALSGNTTLTILSFDEDENWEECDQETFEHSWYVYDRFLQNRTITHLNFDTGFELPDFESVPNRNKLFNRTLIELVLKKLSSVDPSKNYTDDPLEALSAVVDIDDDDENSNVVIGNRGKYANSWINGNKYSIADVCSAGNNFYQKNVTLLSLLLPQLYSETSSLTLCEKRSIEG